MSEQVEVAIVGAGLAGLRAAATLSRAGVQVAVFEASDGPGGRVRSDRVDGLILDRGFQILNTGYPAVQSCLDLEALDLQPFLHGCAVGLPDGPLLLADPFRTPDRIADTLSAPVGSTKDKARLVAMSAWDALAPAAMLKGARERTAAADLRRRGFSEQIRHRLLHPFLQGVFLDGDLGTSSTVFHLVWRAFVRGTQAVPAAGMQAMPDQLAAGLPEGTIRFGHAVDSVGDGTLQIRDGDRIDAEAVLVATDGPAAARLLPGLHVPDYRSVTTYYHLADEPPVSHAALVLDGSGRTPIVNSVVLTNAAPSYADGARVLVSTSVLGSEPIEEAEIRTHLATLYGVSTRAWEHVRTDPIAAALPDQPPPAALRRPVRIGPRLLVAGDHRDTASAQGALVSGRRAATAILARLRRDEI